MEGNKHAAIVNKKMSLIPMPVEVLYKEGYFKVKPNTFIFIDVEKTMQKNVQGTVSLFVDQIEASSGIKLMVVDSKSLKRSANSIMFEQYKSVDILPREGYLLDVSSRQITIKSNTPAGFFYGMQTLLQLMPVSVYSPQMVPELENGWNIRCIHIRDYPRFQWRGIMLDSSRHFQSVEFIKRYLDLMAMHKLNVFHWHLVDGHGWRIEIKKYPKLTEISAWRNQPGYSEENGPYGGYYTQDQIRDVLKYAEQRQISVLPEIEMPGHSWEVFAAYPELSCTEEKQEVAFFFTYPANAQRFPNLPGSDVFCAGKEEGFRFLEDVLMEVMELFPNKYIHIGGDEVDKKWWKQCDKCQRRMKAEGLKNEEELQSYFIQRIEKFLNSHGRKLIGWDEILEGGLAKDATVMSWRGVEGGIESARMGHDVVMTPQKPLYFDHGQTSDPLHPPHWPGIETIQEVYNYEPIPSELTEEQGKRILGAQANMWTVFTHTPELIELQTFPRACALSETVWSQKTVRNLDNFMNRLDVHYGRLDVLDVNYYKTKSIEVGKWSPGNITEAIMELSFDVSEYLESSGEYNIGFLYSTGSHGLDIYEVTLLVDGEVFSNDTHRGFTGWQNKYNNYIIKSPEFKHGVSYQLRMKVASSGGTDSYGSIYISSLLNDPFD